MLRKYRSDPRVNELHHKFQSMGVEVSKDVLSAALLIIDTYPNPESFFLSIKGNLEQKPADPPT
jgi:hypothetical protein